MPRSPPGRLPSAPRSSGGRAGARAPARAGARAPGRRPPCRAPAWPARARPASAPVRRTVSSSSARGTTRVTRPISSASRRRQLPSRQDQLEDALRRRRPQDRRQDHERQEPELDLRKPEDRVVGGDHQVARRGQPAAARQRVAVDPRDHRRSHPRDRLEDPGQARVLLPRLEDRRRPEHALEIGAGAEGPLARAPEDDDPRLRVSPPGGPGPRRAPGPSSGSARCALPAG